MVGEPQGSAILGARTRWSGCATFKILTKV